MFISLHRLLLSGCLMVFLLGATTELAMAQGDWTQTLRARGGLSYFQDSLDSQVGALYGLDLSVPVFEHANFYGSFTHNHFDLGSQFLGTLGGYRQGQAGGDLLERLSGGLLFDHYTDTRFDGLYLSQLRSFAGFALTENLGVGATYTSPLEDADSTTIALPGGGTGPATLRNAELVEGYVSLRWGQSLVTGAIGQRQDPNDLVASLYTSRQLSSQLSLYTNTSYAGSDSWASTFGLQWVFGSGHRTNHPGLLATADEPPTLVRAQNNGRQSNPYNDPSLGHNLNLDVQRFGSLITVDGVGVSSTSLTTTGGTDSSAPEDGGGLQPSDTGPELVSIEIQNPGPVNLPGVTPEANGLFTIEIQEPLPENQPSS